MKASMMNGAFDPEDLSFYFSLMTLVYEHIFFYVCKSSIVSLNLCTITDLMLAHI